MEEQTQQEARLREAEQKRLKHARHAYAEYPQTPLWKRRSEDELYAAGRGCQMCNCSSVPLNVHHRTYQRLARS